jgi:hypothetical protein
MKLIRLFLFTEEGNGKVTISEGNGKVTISEGNVKKRREE